MESLGLIGWRASAMQAYVICTFIRGLENSIRSTKRQRPKKMPSFAELFEPRVRAAGRNGEPAGLAEFEKQMGWAS